MGSVEDAAKAVRDERKRRGWSTTELAARARAIGLEQGDTLKLSQQLVSQFENGQTKQIPRWHRYVLEAFRLADEGNERAPDLPLHNPAMDYLQVEVMPTFGGMGGGGNGDDDGATALLPRQLVEDQLRATPADLLLIEVRGDSMMPDFLHGDQILVDRRDRNPRQPGPFALFDGDGIVIKLVERVPAKRGYYRVFSANVRYSEYEVDEHDVKIIGRPVWFARQI